MVFNSIITQVCAISNQKIRSLADFFGKLGHPEGTVVAQTVGCQVLDLEKRVVDLARAGVHDAAQTAAEGACAPRHRLKRRNADTGLVRAEREPLDGRNADAHAGKRAGTVRDGQRVYVVYRHAAVREQRLRHRQKRARMGQTAVLEGLRDQPVVLGQRDRSAHRRGLKSENFHCPVTSSIVTTRSFSPSP